MGWGRVWHHKRWGVRGGWPYKLWGGEGLELNNHVSTQFNY